MSANKSMPTRRRFLATALGASLVAGVSKPALSATTPARIVVIGGGYAGSTVARFLRAADPSLDVTLIEPNRTFYSCPFSNLVIGGLKPFSVLQFSYHGLEAAGVRLVFDKATHVDTTKRTVRTHLGQTFVYDRLVVAPGIELIWDAIEGYDKAAAELMPHAWKAGPQTLLLRKQLYAMPDDGVIAIAPPTNPFRCPPGPYERASLIANYLKTHKPRAKLLILDAKEHFSKEILFRRAWKELYGDTVEWHSVLDFGRIVAVRPKERVLVTETREFRVDVANIIPPQRAAAIAHSTGLADESGWCPIDPVTFESRLQPGVHVLGDSAIAGAMPKSAFSANAQAKVCALQIARLLQGDDALPTKLENICYSLVAPNYGISIVGVYKQGKQNIEPIKGAGGISPIHASSKFRQLEADYGESWYRSITGQVFG